MNALPLSPLSPREKQMLRRIAAGKTDAEIAGRLGGSEQQVSEQRVRLLAKLGITSLAELSVAVERLAFLSKYRGKT